VRRIRETIIGQRKSEEPLEKGGHPGRKYPPERVRDATGTLGESFLAVSLLVVSGCCENEMWFDVVDFSGDHAVRGTFARRRTLIRCGEGREGRHFFWKKVDPRRQALVGIHIGDVTFGKKGAT
jgi:hypothetical protein